MHFVKEKLDNGLICTPEYQKPACRCALDNDLICTPCANTRSQLADVLTNDLNNVTFYTIISKLGIENAHSPA